MYPEIEYLAIKGRLDDLHRRAAEERLARRAGRHRWAPRRPRTT